jgi:pilus assembly protein CpaE
MAANPTQNVGNLTAVLVCPNRDLATELHSAMPDQRAFHIVADIKTYPTEEELEALLRQARPDVVLLDLSADTDRALQLVSSVGGLRPTVHVVGLHNANDAGIVIRSLRAGATEFLCSPFERDSFGPVVSRILRLRQDEVQDTPERGRLYAFAGAKAGQGVTMVATNAAFVASQEGSRRVLLIDLDLLGGTISFALRANHHYNVLDAIRHAEKLDKALWSSLVTTRDGVDILLAPERPESITIETARIGEVLEFARSQYEIVITDLPSVYDRVSQAPLGDANQVFLVSNPELPSLHLARKCISYLEQVGMERQQFSLVVNRMHRRQELTVQDIQKVFNFPISFVFPEDHGATHRALTMGKSVAPNCELGRALRKFGKTSFGEEKAEPKKKSAMGMKLTALLSNG